MNLKSIAASLAYASLLVSGATWAADPLKGDAAAGQGKAATCVACHGVDGNSVNPEWPSLAGQHSKYVAKQLKLFKSGGRQSATMAPMAMGLSEQDMHDLGAYYESQKSRGLEADKGRVELGQRLYRGGTSTNAVPACIACHGPGGRGNPQSDYPSIRGQYAVYMAAQLNAYKSGGHIDDANKVMRDIASRLSADEIAALASYMQGLR